jgi:hypothetical protein
MKDLSIYLLLAGIALALGACGGKDPVTSGGGGGTPTTVTLGLEDLTLDQQINVGSQYTTNGINVVVERFQWSNLTWTTSGWANVENQQHSGGTGQDIWTNNVNLNFRLPYPVSAIDFKCRDFGGNCNITINSDFRNVEDLNVLNGQTIDGVRVTITGAAGSPLVVSLVGNLTAFKVGGQEFAVDDVAYTYTP